MGRLDIYTKGVFTVIAVALSAIAIENVGAGAFAQSITAQVETPPPEGLSVALRFLPAMMAFGV